MKVFVEHRPQHDVLMPNSAVKSPMLEPCLILPPSGSEDKDGTATQDVGGQRGKLQISLHTYVCENCHVHNLIFII